MNYVDGLVLPVPSKTLAANLRLARKAGKNWREYGTLDYCECVGDDVKVMKDPRLAHMDPKSMPFGAKRMIYGGFKSVVEA